MVIVLECLLLWIHFIGDDDKPLAGWLGITLLKINTSEMLTSNHAVLL